jgi:hypothetical protein
MTAFVEGTLSAVLIYQGVQAKRSIATAGGFTSRADSG